MKKIKLTLVTLLAALSTNAFATFDVVEAERNNGGIIYKLEKDASDAKKIKYQATVVGISTGMSDAAAATITIPAETTDGDGVKYPVVTIANDWAAASSKKNIKTLVTSLTVNSKTALPSFTGFTKLETLKVGAASTIEYFAGVDDAVKVTIKSIDLEDAEGITTINADAFKVDGDKYKLLTTVKLPKKLTKINARAFRNSNVTAITLPETLVTIEGYAFAGATALASIAIPATVETIGDNAFMDVATLTAVDFSKAAALKTIGASAFKGTKLGKTSFKGCAALEEIKESAFEGIETFNAVLGSATALKTIGASAFKGTATENANIPTVENIGENAFFGCEALKAVAMTAAKSIGNNAFNGCKLLAKVTIPAGVTVISDGMFWNCEALANVTFNCANATALGSLAFANTALTSADLSGTKVTELKANVFKGCTALETITLPKTVTTIAANVFADAIISELDLSETGVTTLNNMFGYWDKDASAYKPNDKDHPNTTLKTLKLGDVEIPASMFAYFTALETVEMGNGLVNEKAFANCTSLTSFTKGNSHIYSYAFENDAKLETVVMGDGIVSANAFYMCAALKTFDYAKDAATITNAINEKAFIGCTYPVIINTINSYVEAHKTAPTNAKYGTGAILTVKTVKDNGGSGKFFMYFHNDNTNNAVFNKADGNFYSIYVDEGTAYFQSVRAIDGKIYVKPNENIIIKTDEAKEVEYTLTTTDPSKTAVLVDEVICLTADKKLVDFQAAPGVKYSDGNDVTFKAGDYIYRLTNKAPMGFGFTYYAGETMKAGQFFILSTTAPDASARLNTVWLDEDGNVESDATAIETVKQAVNDGVVYNMAGQQVDGNYKGIVIKNGKKMIQK